MKRRVSTASQHRLELVEIACYVVIIVEPIHEQQTDWPIPVYFPRICLNDRNVVGQTAAVQIRFELCPCGCGQLHSLLSVAHLSFVQIYGIKLLFAAQRFDDARNDASRAPAIAANLD